MKANGLSGRRHWNGFNGSDLENCCWTTTAALSSDSLARQAVVRFLVAAACLLVRKNRRSTSDPRNYVKALRKKERLANEITAVLQKLLDLSDVIGSGVIYAQ